MMVVALAGLPSAAFGQDSVTSFMLVAAPNNIQGCHAADTAISRPYTVTVKGSEVTIKSSGGIDDKMKLVSPGVYHTTFALGMMHLDLTAEVAATPKKLTVVSKSLGCHWSATAP
jgi:hypothetical protein